MTNTSVLVYSTDNHPADCAFCAAGEGMRHNYEPPAEPCLGSQGIISTSQCVRIAEMATGEPCPLCIL